MQSHVQSTPRTQSTNDVRRDPGVANAVWRQLEADKAAAEEAKKKAIEEIKRRDAELSRAAQRQQAAEAAARALAQQRARDQAEREELRRQQEAARIREAEAKAERERAAAALLQMRREEEKKKREEERIQQKLRNLGVCVQGFPWIKQSSGYRCAGGFHFIPDFQLR